MGKRSACKRFTEKNFRISVKKKKQKNTKHLEEKTKERNCLPQTTNIDYLLLKNMS